MPTALPTDPPIDEIRKRLTAFAVDWKDTTREKEAAQRFWVDFYGCYGISLTSGKVAYEKEVTKIGGERGYIDNLIPGLLLVEHKSTGKDLGSAFRQALEYDAALPEAERPRYIITCDFARFRLYDLDPERKRRKWRECTLADLPKRVDWFMFLCRKDTPEIMEELPVNRQAAYAVSKLHEALLRRADFRGRDLEVFLTRLLFCFFADSTGVFGENQMFFRLIQATPEDGSDTGTRLIELFEVLNTPEDKRSDNLKKHKPSLAAFPYVNGKLFSERTGIPEFDPEMRALLLDCCKLKDSTPDNITLLDWSHISPAIFGAMFQGVLEAHHPDEARQATRRELGAHYTSERNILRVINPLFMDGLRAEFERAGNSKARLRALYDKLPTLTFFDPACGCGNFLVIAYRELRRLEMDVAGILFGIDGKGGKGKGLLESSHWCRVRVSQFYGIEIDDAAAHIARVALWITDHQMNLVTGERFGYARPTVPLVDTPQIHSGNALRQDWADILPPEKCSYVMSNPPFVGAKLMNDTQREEAHAVFAGIKSGGLLDYVAAWYVKALTYIRANPETEVAFVSTNSITQGEQVAALWPSLLQGGVHIRFAHRTFRWSNEGKGIAAVHCVIIGFGLKTPERCTIWDYSEDIQANEGTRIEAKRINPYLVDGPDVVLTNRRVPICNVPEIGIGNKPIDGGNYLFTDDEKARFLAVEPKAEPFFRQWVGAEEFINGKSRWCLWLGDAKPHELRAMPECLKRIDAVRQFRLDSSSEPTQKLAGTPTRFHVEFIPAARYLLVPRVSSERRSFVPVGFLPPETFPSDSALVIPNATLYHFAILNSTMHNAWMRAVCGRLKSDYRYSAGIVYNNFPWPEPTDKQRAAIEAAGQAILDARAQYPESTLADLYDPNTMPPELSKAHQANDRAVDAAYGYGKDKSEAARVAFLFDRYGKLTSLLPTEKPGRARRARATDTRQKTGQA